MRTIYAVHPPRPSHLATVARQMQSLGSPTITVYDGGDHYRAIEGAHRLAAAQQLGLAVRVRIMDMDDTVTHDCPDIPSPCTVREWDEAQDYRDAVAYRLDVEGVA